MTLWEKEEAEYSDFLEMSEPPPTADLALHLAWLALMVNHHTNTAVGSYRVDHTLSPSLQILAAVDRLLGEMVKMNGGADGEGCESLIESIRKKRLLREKENS